MLIQHFENLWEKFKFQIPYSEPEKYWDEMAPCIAAWNSSEISQNERIISFLQSKNLLSPSSNVLDIGCGAGNLTKQISAFALKITGTDISGNALSYAMQNINSTNQEKLTFVKGDWNNLVLKEYNWEKNFDLVFSSMAPVIDNKDNLLKMIAASKKFCFISYPVKKIPALASTLAQMLKLNDTYDPGNSVYCLYNVLSLLGYFPEINYENLFWQYKQPLDTAYKYYTKLLSLNNHISDTDAQKIYFFLEKNSTDGMISDTIHTKNSFINWQV